MGACVLLVAQVASGISAGFTVPALAARAPVGHPNRFDPRAGTVSVKPAATAPAPASSAPAPSPQVIERPTGVSMQPATVALDPAKAVQFVGSDGVLEVDVPAGAVTAADVTAAGGTLGLAVRQLLPASGGTSGGSGHVSFGTFLVQVVDGSGKPAGQGLRQPLGLKLHFGAQGSALDVAHAVLVLNPALPSWVSLSAPAAPPSSPVSGARTQTASSGSGTPVSKLGSRSVEQPALDAATGTLSASVTASGPSTALSWDSVSPVAAVGRPDPYEPTLSAGGLAAGYQLQVPAGPGGLTPKLELGYDSAAVNDVEAAQAANGWVGQGFSLGLGSVSWSERKDSGCPGCGWESSWQLNDAFGTAAELVPPALNISTGYDDTGNPIAGSPVTWHTAPETHARVVSFTSPSPPGGVSPSQPQCFRVWLPSGLMEEFGCTPDSMQWYVEPAGPNAGKAYVDAWWLDLVTDPLGNQIHLTYQQDVEVGAGGPLYPRDVVPATVEYDSPGCHDAQHACTGASWAPLMRASFQASHAVAHAAGTVCSSSGNARCDDPADLSGSGGLTAPTVESTFVLNDVLVQVRASGSAAWNTLRTYRLGYGEWAGGTITDPFTGLSESTAGALELDQLTEIGSDGTTAPPATSFGYQFVTRYYEDTYSAPQPSTNCGPSWMQVGGCTLWSQSGQNNGYFLSQVSNGQGLVQTFAWSNARNNSHGVVGGGANTSNPLYCDDSSRQSTYPCTRADDQAWSRAVLSTSTQAVGRVSQAGQGGTQTTSTVTGTSSYSYQLTYPLIAPPCGDCTVGAVWGSEDDADTNDFYNVRFMGYASATVSLPDGASELHRFYSTLGIGLYDRTQVACNVHGNPCWGAPWSDPMDASHGHEYELDRYDTSGRLLERVQTSWRALCPPQGVTATAPSGTWGNWNGSRVAEADPGNPVMVCDVQRSGEDRAGLEGVGGNPVPHQLSGYTYDSYGRVASQSQVNLTGLADSSGRSNPAPSWTAGVSVGAPGMTADGDTAMGFDGSTGTVAMNVAGIDTAGGHQVTVELWMSWDGTRSCVMPFGFVSGYDLFLCGGSFGFNTANSDILGVAGKVAANTPVHVVAVFGNGSESGNLLYLNGVQQTLTQLTGTPVARSVSQAANISGWAFNSFLYGWSGVLDEVAIYNGALPVARVSAHYSAGAGYRAAVLADSPQAYYRLDQPVAGTSPNLSLRRPQYVWDDTVNTAVTPPTGTYLVDYPAFGDLEDLAGNRYQCSYTSYDGQAYTTGQSSGLTLGAATTVDRYTSCGSPPGFTPSGKITTTSRYDAFGNLVATDDPDSNAGVGGHTGCTVSGTLYSRCLAYDGTFGVLPAQTVNALNQTASTGYQAPYQPPANIADSSGHGLQGSWSGDVTFGRAGLVSGDSDTAMGFGGQTGSVGLTLTGVDTTSSHQVTVELWMSWSGGSATQMPFGFNGYDLYVVPGSGFGYNTGHADLYGVPMSQVPANTPLHVVAVFTNGSLSSNKLYINGVQQTLSQILGSAQSGTVTAAARIGNWTGPYNYYFNGTLDEVAVYNGALPAARVSAHYSAGAGYRAAVLADAPLAYYRLDDGSPNTGTYTGFGLWPISRTDANGQTTSIGYDALGRETSETLPGETAGLTTLGTAYTVWCSGASAQTPCVEVDRTQRLNSTTTVTSRAFYDGLGHLVETRSPAPAGDVVRYSYYDVSQRLVFQSVPYLVSAYSGGPGSAAYSIPDSTVAGTSYTYDSLGRVLTATDALSHQSRKSYAVACAAPGTGDSGCYVQTLSIDPNGHQGGTLVDGLGRTAYVQRYTGNSQATYAVYATAKYSYDFAGDLTGILQPDGTTTTSFGYDMAGRKTTLTDPDLGAQSYSYDQDGNLVQSVDARGAAGTIFMGYDGLDRPTWRNTTNSPTGAYDTYSYDSTAAGNLGVGGLTGETFSAGTLSGSYAYGYDGRGQQTSSPLTVAGAPSLVQPTFVQQASNHVGGGSATSLGATLGAGVGLGNRIVVVVGVWNSGSPTASGVTDSAGNTYTEVAHLVASDKTEDSIWTAPITAGAGTRPTVTVSTSGPADIGIAVAEYAGLSTAAGSAAVDQTAISSGFTSSAGTVSSGPTGATTAAGELAVGAYVDSGFSDTLSYGSGWSGRVNVSPTTDMELALEDQPVGQGATPNAQVSTGASTTWLMATAVFKPAPSGYTTLTSYDDAGNVLSQRYPDAQTVSSTYTAQGWLSSVATTQGGVTLASNIAYTGTGGAFGEITGMHLGGGYDYSATYDLLDRATDLNTKRTSDGTTMYDQARTFDATSNVTTASTTMPAGTDNQSFCYDEQDRLTWASAATATPPCGGSTTAGTLAAAVYTQSFRYDVMGRLATGPPGSYAYGSSAHVHAATGIGTGWTAAYDAAGNMTCRAPSQSSTCAGTQTGAQLSYNNEGELSSWQNAPSSPSTTAQYLYDGQGQRIEQVVTQGGTTFSTFYLGNMEEVSTTGSTTATTAYYYAGGKRIGLSTGGTMSYLASDGLGSANLTLSAGGSATASKLYAPYGGVRYSSGTMPPSYGFTGQRVDVASGLDYYGARYYDPMASQFTSADTVSASGGFDLWGLSRYSYVEGNPEDKIDPTGHINLTVGDNGGSVPIENGFQGTYSWGGGPVTGHGGFSQPSRPLSRSTPEPTPGLTASPSLPLPPDTAVVRLGGVRCACDETSLSSLMILPPIAGANGDDEGEQLPPAYEIIRQFRDLTSDEQDSEAALQTVAGLDEGDTVSFNSKNAARRAFMEGSDLRTAANRFFRDATGKSEQFRITRFADSYEFQFFSPAKNPGYGKLYVQEVSTDGQIINEYKVTTFQNESLEVKWIRQNGTLVAK